jgi:hypothetical protein
MTERQKDDMPGEIWAVRWGDDEPMNGNWVDCCDPTTDNVKYIRADMLAEALRESDRFLQNYWGRPRLTNYDREKVGNLVRANREALHQYEAAKQPDSAALAEIREA